jgi:acyl-CoA synthetase (AMP-forming)/AMP-acid ligase II
MFADPIRYWTRTHPQRIAVVVPAADQRVTYAELNARIDRAAAMLAALGVRRGERVGVLAWNRIEDI